MKIEKLLKLYMTQHVEKNCVAWERHQYAVNRLVDVFGDLDLTNCVPYIPFYIQSRTVSDSTISRELAVLKAAMRYYGFETHYIKMPVGKVVKVLWLLPDEKNLLWSHIEADLIPFFDVLYLTASRRKAIEMLEWSQVDLINNVLHLAKLGEVQTNKRRPSIPIVKELQSVFQQLQTINGTKRYVWGDKPVNAYYHLNIAASNAGLSNLEERQGRQAGSLCPHVLRHTRITNMLLGGTSIYAVSKYVGDSIKTLETVYAHATATQLSHLIE